MSPNSPLSSVRGAPTRRADLVDPRVLADLGQLELIARSVVEGFLIGLHRSPFRGFSVEFAEDRPYNPGDDLRYLDWRMLARSDRYYIKQFEEETNLRAYLLLDTSASMGWGSDPGKVPRKLEYARMLTAALGILLLRQGDATGLLAFDERVREHLPPRAGRLHEARLLGSLVRLEAGRRTDAGSAIRDVALRLRRRGLVVLVSDLLVDPDLTRRALGFLRHRGHEVLVLHVMDPGERELPAVGDATYFDPETGQELTTNSAALRRRYRESVRRALEEWRRECHRLGVDYHLLTTDRPLGVGLRHYLDKRARLG